MVMHRSLSKMLFIAILVALLATANAGACRQDDVPFRKNIIGKEFVENDHCLKADIRHFLYVWKKEFVYEPYRSTRFGGGRPSFDFCYEKYVFQYRGRSLKPVIIHFLVTSDAQITGFASAVNTTPEETERLCKEQQPRLRYYASGPTRKKFIAAVRMMVKRISEISDYNATCSDDPTGMPYFPNPAADSIVSYLIGISHANSFCAQ